MEEYELPIKEHKSLNESAAMEGLADSTIMENAAWFVTLRWYVIAVFSVSGAAGWFFKSGLSRIGLSVPSIWLWSLAGVLLVANLPLYLRAKQFGPDSQRTIVMRHIWTQIGLDLLVITALVYKLGTVETFAAFTYLFHIVLACIFFPPRQSLGVTCIAAALYMSVVLLESFGVIPLQGVMSEVERTVGRGSATRIWLSIFGLSIWLIVWYITSTLSRAVRIRDQKLNILNQQLMAADKEKNRQMLLTTHDLKAPFAGIESNIQVLKYQYWEDLPEKIKEIIERIDSRAHMLRERINAILVLGNLKSKAADEMTIESFDLRILLQAVVETLDERAELRDVSFSIDVPELFVSTDKEQFGTLLANLVSNAISYSNEHGTAYITAGKVAGKTEVVIRDEGIGIRPDAMPEIFDDYFRTREATKFNKQSTGLGLAIVKVIAQKLQLSVKVLSEVDHGTEFRVTIP